MKEPSLSPTPKPTDKPQSFPVDVLAIPASSTAVPNSRSRINEHNANLQIIASTPLVDLSALQLDTQTPNALADSVSTSGLLTWSQVLTTRQTADSTAFSLRNPAALRRPAPSHYMIGDPLTIMHESDLSSDEVEYFARIISSSQWKEIRKDFDK